MARFRQNGHGEFAERFTQRRSDIAQVGVQRQTKVDSAFSARTDDQLFHVHIGRVEEAALIAHRQYRQRVGLAHRRHARAFDRVDRDIHRIAFAGPDLFTDVEHRRFVDLAFTDDDSAVDVNLIKHNAHGVDGCAVCGIFVATAQPLVACEGGSFGDAGKLDSKFTFHEVLVQSKGIARSLSQSGEGEGWCGLSPSPRPSPQRGEG